MPRDLPLGNGDFLVSFDSRYRLRDLFFPYVGMENQTVGDPSRFGLWVDGAFSWTHDDGWDRRLAYAHETLVGSTTLSHDGLGLRLECRDAVDFDRNVYLKEITVHDLSGRDRRVRLFQHIDAHLYGNDVGDSAYYDPRTRGIVLYKGRRYLLLSGTVDGTDGLASFAIGYKETSGREGTWRDAEDGELSRNPVAQGSIDTVGQLSVDVVAAGSAVATFWIAIGQDYDEVSEIAGLVRDRGTASFLTRTTDYWRLWANKERSEIEHLPERLGDLYKRSTLIIRTHVDNRGAIIAATDSDILQFNRDTYSYLWPRDGALVAYALDLAGYGEATRRFFRLCAEVISRDGYLLHKYNPDGSLGSSWHAWMTPDGELDLPIQEDETGLPLWALWKHYDRHRDIEFVRPLYRRLVRAAADFLVAYRDPATKLPRPSFDLWEERRGVHAFTLAAVWAGLIAASRFAAAFGQREHTDRYLIAAEELKVAALQHLYDEERGRFVRGVHLLPDGTALKDPTLDVSLAGLWLFGMLPADDPRVVSTMRAVEERLWVRTAIGGLARYENDGYLRQSDDVENVPGNPWFIGTLWLAEHHIELATRGEELARPLELLEWCATKTLPSGVLAEQVHPYTGDPLSVSPLTWSHAAFVSAAHRYARKAEEIAHGLRDRVRAAGEVIG
ncbi:MAG: glycoside hydrolase family 15 protein [Candidatus Limnocylindria bacterium]